MTTRSSLILVIDDEQQLVRAVRTILESRGFEVAEAATGAEAMDRLLERSPDLIVLDLTLPDIDGLDLLQRLRAFTQLPILVLSARDSEQDKVVALTTGADDYLTKPFSAGEFVARVGVLLRQDVRFVDGADARDRRPGDRLRPPTRDARRRGRCRSRPPSTRFWRRSPRIRTGC